MKHARRREEDHAAGRIGHRSLERFDVLEVEGIPARDEERVKKRDKWRSKAKKSSTF